MSVSRGFLTCIESSHVTCSQRLRIFIGIMWNSMILYLFIWIYIDFASNCMVLEFWNPRTLHVLYVCDVVLFYLRKLHFWKLSSCTCIWSLWSYLVNIWSDCEWIGSDSHIFIIEYGLTGTISKSTTTVEVPQEFPRCQFSLILGSQGLLGSTQEWTAMVDSTLDEWTGSGVMNVCTIAKGGFKNAGFYNNWN